MDDNKKMAFDAALDLVKLLITRASGILALTATFLKDILTVIQGHEANLKSPHWSLYVKWSLMLPSMFFELLGHRAIAGILNEVNSNHLQGHNIMI